MSQQQPDSSQYQQTQTEPQSQMTPPPQWPPVATKKPRRRWPWIVGIIVAIVIVAIIIGVLVSNNASPTYSSANVVDTTVATLDKDGNSDSGMSVHFTATIIGFVKDSNGNTAGANVDDPNTSGVLQVAFPDGTDLSHLNTGDTLEVWGVDRGSFSGTNAFGATIQEVGVAAVSMTDKTTGYQAG